MVLASTQEARWRTIGPYLPTLASKAALLEETRLFLVTLGQQADLETTIQTLVNLVLGQRSLETRMTIAEIIRARLARWNPPAWVLQDLVSFANAGSLDALRAALLLHVPRQDHLLYDFVQAVIVPRWQQGESEITIAHAQTFFDLALEDHLETARWGFETRLRLARGLLATLRDYGLLRGTVNKQITLPVIPLPVVHHLIHLLQAEADHAPQRTTSLMDEAVSWYSKATAIFSDLQNRKGLAEAYGLLAELQEASGQQAEALGHWKAAYESLQPLLTEL